MVEVISIVSIIVAVGTAVGGVFGFLHFKLKSNCCSCCMLECSEREKDKRKSISPPMSPIKLEIPETASLKDKTVQSLA
jgi:hypothetical protein